MSFFTCKMIRWLGLSVLAASLAACGGGGSSSVDAVKVLPAGTGPQRVIVQTAVTVALPSGTDPAGYELRSAAGAASASAGSLPTLSRDVVALAKGGEAFYVAAVRPGAAVEIGARSSALALVLARLGMAAADDDRYAKAVAAISSHARFADLVGLIDTAAGSGMKRPLDVQANPLLGKLIGLIAADVGPKLTASAAVGLPRWLARAVFDGMPGATAHAKTYENTSAGGEVSVVAQGTTLKVQNFRAVPWIVSKRGTPSYGLATGRKNGLKLDGVVQASWPPSVDLANLEGSTETEVPFSVAGLTGSGSEAVVLEHYSLCKFGINAADGFWNAPATANPFQLIGAAYDQAMAPYAQRPALAQSTLFNFLDGTALLAGVAADGVSSGNGSDASKVVSKLAAIGTALKNAPCQAKRYKPYTLAGVALLSGLRDGLIAKGFAADGNADHLLGLEAIEAALNAAQQADALVDAIGEIDTGACDSAVQDDSPLQAFKASILDDLKGDLSESAVQALASRLVADLVSQKDFKGAVLRSLELLLVANGKLSTGLDLALGLAKTGGSPYAMMVNLIVNLWEDDDMQSLLDAAIGTGAKATLAAAAKINPWTAAATTGWKIGTGLAVYLADSCLTPETIRMTLNNGVVNNIPSPLLRLVVKVDQQEVLRQDDAIDNIRRTLSQIDAPTGSRIDIQLTADQPGMFAANHKDLAHLYLDGSFIDAVQQPTLLSEANIFAAKGSGGQISLVHRMLCTRDNFTSLGKKQYSQIDMGSVQPQFQCMGAGFKLEDNYEFSAFTPQDGVVKVVGDYDENFAGTNPVSLPGLVYGTGDFNTLTDVYPATNKTIFKYSGVVTESWRQIDIVFTHFAYTETHRFTIPIKQPNQAPEVSLSVSWPSMLGSVDPVVDEAVTLTALARDRDSALARFSFDFGDGRGPVDVSANTSTRSESRVFSSPGQYVATVKVVDDAGAVASRQVTLNVRAKPGPSVTAVTCPSAVIGSLVTCTINGQNLPPTAVIALEGANCADNPIPNSVAGTGFTQVCTPGSTAGSKKVTVKTDTDANGGVVVDASRMVMVLAAPTAPIIIPASAFLPTSTNIAVKVTTACDGGLVLAAPPYLDTPNAGDWSVAVPMAGSYRIDVEYSAAVSRPVQALMDGVMVNGNALADVNGTWCASPSMVRSVGTVTLSAGTHTFRLQRSSVFPHLKEIRFVPI